MKIWYLTHLADSPSNAPLAAAAEAQGVDWLQIDPAETTIELEPGARARIFDGEGKELQRPDVWFTRLGSSAPESSLQLVGLLESEDLPGMNRTEGIRIARDKAATLTRLGANRIEHPRTIVLRSMLALERAAAMIAGPPWVLKTAVGTQGLGVALAESREALLETAEAFFERDEVLLLQEFVAEARGRDLRLFVVGGELVGAMRRQGGEGEFRSNLHRGGRGEPVAVDDYSRELAILAARVLGLEVAGIDLLESERGPLVIEVNAAPGLAGIQSATGIDVAGAILDRLLRI